jgi:hypothetical protein
MADLDNERLAAETRKWVAEELKLGAEREKLFQEALKLERERAWYIPLALLGSNALAALIGVIAARVIH